jgi:hypothetical protein
MTSNMPARMRRARRLLVLPLVVVLPLLAAGCNGKRAAYKVTDTEGIYLAAGGLKYQIQLSRELNPSLPEDSAYLSDLAPGTAPPGKGREWFAVWMRVQNDGKHAARSTSDFDITYTLGHFYTPIGVSPRNILSYQPTTLARGSIYPYSETAIAQSGPREGSVILFQIDTSAYQNRPLVLHIHAPGGDEASVTLDL